MAAAIAALTSSLAGVAPAGAAGVPSRATAQAALLGELGVSSPRSEAANDGTQPLQESSFSRDDPGLLIGTPLVSIEGGTVSQHARASTDGSSAACAGLLATGSTLALAADGTCEASAGVAGAVVALPGAIVSTSGTMAACFADAGTFAGSTTLRDVSVSAPDGTDPVVLPEFPAPNTVVRAHGYTFVLNEQYRSWDGRNLVIAMRTTNDRYGVGGSTGVVSCNVDVPILDVPAVPLQGWPVWLGLLVVGGATAAVRRGRGRVRSVA